MYVESNSDYTPVVTPGTTGHITLSCGYHGQLFTLPHKSAPLETLWYKIFLQYHTGVPHSKTTHQYHTVIPHRNTTQHYHTAIPHSTTTQEYHTAKPQCEVMLYGIPVCVVLLCGSDVTTWIPQLAVHITTWACGTVVHYHTSTCGKIFLWYFMW